MAAPHFGAIALGSLRINRHGAPVILFAVRRFGQAVTGAANGRVAVVAVTRLDRPSKRLGLASPAERFNENVALTG